MSIDINDLINKYASISFDIDSVYELSVIQKSKSIGGKTMKGVCGFIIPFRGKAKYTASGVPYILEPGTIFHGGSYIDLDKEVLGDGDWNYGLIHYRINGPNLEKKYFEKINYSLNLEINQYAEITKIVHQLHESYNNPAVIGKLKTKFLFYNFLERLMQNSQQKNFESEENLIEAILNYIDNNFDKNLTISELAQKHDMDSKHFSYIFQKYVGISPKQFIVNYRINKAKKLLINSEYSINETALMVGYEDAFYFSRIFKKITGVSPTDFRRKLGKNPWAF